MLFNSQRCYAIDAFEQLKSEQSPLKDQLNKAQKPVCLIAVLHSVSELPDIHTDDFHDNSMVPFSRNCSCLIKHLLS